MPFDRITIINVQAPRSADLNTELQWLGAALGLFGDRDKDSSCFRIFVALLRASQQSRILTSDELAAEADLSRGTVVHHLNRLRDAGLVTHYSSGYAITGDGLSQAIQRLEKDVSEALQLFGAVAKDIESRLS